MPKYETVEDAQAVALLSWHLGGVWNVTLRGARPDADWVALDNKGTPVAVIELKRRKCESGQYTTYMVSLSKVEKVRAFAQSLGVMAVLVVAWKDRMAYVDLSKYQIDPTQITIGGRFDRGDPADVENVVHIPVAAFTAIP